MLQSRPLLFPHIKTDASSARSGGYTVKGRERGDPKWLIFSRAPALFRVETVQSVIWSLLQPFQIFMKDGSCIWLVTTVEKLRHSLCHQRRDDSH
ncbi:hypothetical protein ElyMa_000092400 [Elysia marginata]|uniref:Uncharacterized protein n=1 Tax=Elysia marginata TaxID=1093978 RepID=A0AAV4EJL6_9GAST|nr:hypothetical protein ElyMa_000092400 [Elysia marginata]